MVNLLIYRYGLSLLFGLVLMVSMVFNHSGGEARPAQQASPVAIDSAYVEMHRLLNEEKKIDENWLSSAKQWTASNPLTDDAAKAIKPTWTALLDDAHALQKYAGNVLQKDRILKVRRLLTPYFRNDNLETRQLATQMDERLQSMMQLSTLDPSLPVMVLNWSSLDQITQDLDRIQFLLVEFRRISLSSATPVEARFSLGLFGQLAETFPTTRVIELTHTSKRLMQNRWAMLYQMERFRLPNHPAEKSTPLSAQPVQSQGSIWLGLLGLLLLVGVQHQTRHWQQRAEREAQTVEVLQGHLQEHQLTQAEAEVQAKSTAKTAATPKDDWAQKVADELADLRGRIKSARLRFDTGQSQEAVARDLSLVDEKLAQWDRDSTSWKSTGNHHG